jgi:hypothetical protein
MNLVDFDPESRNLVVSNQFWLYFTISVPLTAVTLVCWRCRMHAYRKGSIDDDAPATAGKRDIMSDANIEMV